MREPLRVVERRAPVRDVEEQRGQGHRLRARGALLRVQLPPVQQLQRLPDRLELERADALHPRLRRGPLRRPVPAGVRARQPLPADARQPRAPALREDVPPVAHRAGVGEGQAHPGRGQGLRRARVPRQRGDRVRGGVGLPCADLAERPADPPPPDEVGPGGLPALRGELRRHIQGDGPGGQGDALPLLQGRPLPHLLPRRVHGGWLGLRESRRNADHRLRCDASVNHSAAADHDCPHANYCPHI
mmetsp:Transcript_100424/g.281402  ORF Transcript_100424/g.281402 Transcript_100424/m.281402 type:complete len:245 (-) Transcript_100424:193-927(-)